MAWHPSTTFRYAGRPAQIAWSLLRLDGQAVAGDGQEGIQAVSQERNRIAGDIAPLFFEVLASLAT